MIPDREYDHKGEIDANGTPIKNYWGRYLSLAELYAYRVVKSKFDDIHRNTKVKRIYAYTQTFTGKSNSNTKHKRQFASTAPNLCSQLRESTEFIIIPEFTKLQSIHYHGVIGVTDNIRYAKRTFWALKYLGYIELKPIKDIQMWILYMIKDIAENCLILEKGIDDLILTQKEYPQGITLDDFIEKKKLKTPRKLGWKDKLAPLLKLIVEDSEHESEAEIETDSD